MKRKGYAFTELKWHNFRGGMLSANSSLLNYLEEDTGDRALLREENPSHAVHSEIQ